MTKAMKMSFIELMDSKNLHVLHVCLPLCRIPNFVFLCQNADGSLPLIGYYTYNHAVENICTQIRDAQ